MPHNHPFFSSSRAASIRFRQPSFWIAIETWFRTVPYQAGHFIVRLAEQVVRF